MTTMPLNRTRPFEPWPRFDPGWIDFNPTCVQLPSGRWLGIIRRDAVPPVPGKGTLWTVPLTDALQPAGTPTLLAARGEDPRAVVLGDRVFVFHAIIERNAEDRVCGSAVRLLECTIEGAPGAETLRALQLMELPKNPLGKPPTGSPYDAWEKNWVPFPLGPTEIGLLYGHAPWEVLRFSADPAGTARHFAGAHRGPALRWAWGEIRGGTVPVPWPGDPSSWLTFFHSSAVVGSRKLYFVGACVFDGQAPFTPRLMTPEPLLVAPYRRGAHEHGWRFAGSVVFPLGCAPMPGGHRLLCGLDDGLVAPVEVPADELRRRLRPLDQVLAAQGPAPQATDGQALAASGEPWSLGPFDDKALHAARLLSLLHPGGGLLVDAAPGDGVPLALLAPRFERAVGWAEGPAARHLRRVLALNGIDGAEITAPAEALDALDPAATAALALLRVDDAAAAARVLPGAVHTLVRTRAPVLLQMPPDEAGAAAVAAALDRAQYTCEALFPFTPQRRLALPAERRAEFAWLV